MNAHDYIIATPTRMYTSDCYIPRLRAVRAGGCQPGWRGQHRGDDQGGVSPGLRGQRQVSVLGVDTQADQPRMLPALRSLPAEAQHVLCWMGEALYALR